MCSNLQVVKKSVNRQKHYAWYQASNHIRFISFSVKLLRKQTTMPLLVLHEFLMFYVFT